MRDLTSPDMICNVLGDIPAPDTLDIVPGDVITFEWYQFTSPQLNLAENKLIDFVKGP